MARKLSLFKTIVIVLLVAVVVAFVTAFAQELISGHARAWLTSVVTTLAVLGTLRAIYSR